MTAYLAQRSWSAALLLREEAFDRICLKRLTFLTESLYSRTSLFIYIYVRHLNVVLAKFVSRACLWWCSVRFMKRAREVVDRVPCDPTLDRIFKVWTQKLGVLDRLLESVANLALTWRRRGYETHTGDRVHSTYGH